MKKIEMQRDLSGTVALTKKLTIAVKRIAALLKVRNLKEGV